MDQPLVLALLTQGMYWTNLLYQPYWCRASTGPTPCADLTDAGQVPRPTPCTGLTDVGQVPDQPPVPALLAQGKYRTNPLCRPFWRRPSTGPNLLYQPYWCRASTGPTPCTSLTDAGQVASTNPILCWLGFNFNSAAKLFTVPGQSLAYIWFSPLA